MTRGDIKSIHSEKGWEQESVWEVQEIRSQYTNMHCEEEA
jgi:hypothetical protein